MTGPLWLLLRPHRRLPKLGSQQKRVWKSTFRAAQGAGVSLMQWELSDFPSCPPQDLESPVLFVECGRTLSHLERWDLSPSCGSGRPETSAGASPPDLGDKVTAVMRSPHLPPYEDPRPVEGPWAQPLPGCKSGQLPGQNVLWSPETSGHRTGVLLLL